MVLVWGGDNSTTLHCVHGIASILVAASDSYLYILIFIQLSGFPWYFVFIVKSCTRCTVRPVLHPFTQCTK